MERGTTGAPRNTRESTIAAGQPDLPRSPERPPVGRPRGVDRLIGIVCGRRTKYLVVAVWILVIAATGSFASKLIGAQQGIDSTLLYATLAVVIVLLLLTYRSPVLWLLPIMSAGVALAAAEAVIYYLTQHANLMVNGQTEGILVVLVIGAGTDYALLLIARYREELRRHEDRHAAMAVALRRAGPAIIASGLTVVAGMCCLLAAEPNDISGLGPVAAIGIGIGLIAMVTLLPALLVLFGRWIFWPVRPGAGDRAGGSRRPLTVLVTALTLDIGRHIWWPSSLSRAVPSALGTDRAA